MDHRVAGFEFTAARDDERRVIGLGKLCGFGFELWWPHIGGRGVDQIANQRDGFGNLDEALDAGGFVAQQDARAGGLVVFFIAVEPVLGEQPAERCRAGRTAGETIRALGQGLGEFCKAP